MKPLFHGIFFFAVEPGMVKAAFNVAESVRKGACSPLGTSAGGAKHDHWALFAHNLPEERWFLAKTPVYRKPDIGPVSLASNDMGPAAEEDLGDAREHERAGRRGERGYRRRVKPRDDVFQRKIGRAEGVAPFRHAMGLVNREVADAARLYAREHALPGENLRIRDDEPGCGFSVTPLKASELRFPFLFRLSAAEYGGFHPAFSKSPGLVALERKEGIDNERWAGKQEGRELKT